MHSPFMGWQTLRWVCICVYHTALFVCWIYLVCNSHDQLAGLLLAPAFNHPCSVHVEHMHKPSPGPVPKDMTVTLLHAAQKPP
jgi:hypothetical protein